MAKAKIKDFESTLKSLNAIVDTMEQGDLSLEESLKQFELGIKMTKECQLSLQQAEQKVKILLADNQQLTDFNSNHEE